MVRLQWTPRPPEELVTGYIVYESTDGLNFAQKAVTTEPYLDFNPAPGHYEWEVKAVNFVGTSEASLTVSGPDVPGAPEDVELVAL